MVKGGEKVTINIVNIEGSSNDLISVREVDRDEFLMETAKDLKVRPENMLTFANMLFQYVPTPPVTAFNEILIMYILSYDDYIPHINVDMNSEADLPWNLYIPKKIPNNSIRVFIKRHKRAITQNGIELIIPAGQSIDLVSINNQHPKKLKSQFLTATYKQIYYNYTQNKSYLTAQKVNLRKGAISASQNKIDNIYSGFIDFLIKLREVIPKGRILDVYKNDRKFITDVISNSLLDYMFQYTKDREFPPKLFQYLSMMKKNKETELIMNKQISKQKQKFSIFTNIIQNAFPKRFRIYDSLEKTLANIPKNEREYIEKEYKIKIAFIEADGANRCSHIDVVKRMRLSTDLVKRDNLFEKIQRDYIPHGYIENDSGFVQCRKCKLHLMCPHVVTATKLQLNRSNEPEIKDQLDKYVDALMDNEFVSHCKICHEEMFDKNQEELDNVFFGLKSLYPGIYNFIWSQIMIIHTTLKFNPPTVNVYDFTSVVAYSILPAVIQSKSSFVSSAVNNYVRNSEEGLAADLQIYCLCYIYSFILNGIRTYFLNPKANYIRIFPNEEQKSKQVSDYAKIFLERFTSMHRSIFNQVADLDLTAIFTDIYTRLLKSDMVFVFVKQTSAEQELVGKILQNTKFNFAYEIAKITNFIPTLTPKDTIESYENVIEKVLGMKISSIVRGQEKNDYTKLYEPSVENLSKRIKESMDIYINLPKDGIDLSTKESVKRIKKSHAARIIKNYLAMRRSGKDFEEAKEREKYFILYQTVLRRTPAVRISASINFKWPQKTDDGRITSIINENGDEHIWDTMITDSGKDILISNYKANEVFQIKDYKDSKTGLIRSQTSKLDKSRAERNYLKKHKKIILMSFYRTKCPADGIHDFKDGNKCDKCGLLLKDNNDAAYYEKYLKKFNEDVLKIKNNSMVDCIIKPSEHISTKSKWSYNPRYAIELSELISKPISVIDSIGATEGRTYLQILSGVNRPSLPTSYRDIQIVTAYSHFFNTVSIYTQLSYNGSYEDSTFKKFMKSRGIDISGIANFAVSLPRDIDKPMTTTVLDVKEDHSKSPEELYKCIIEKLCEFVLVVHKNNPHVGLFLIENVINKELTKGESNGKYDSSLFKRKNTLTITETNSLDAKFDAEYVEEVDKSDIFIFNDIDYALSGNS